MFDLSNITPIATTHDDTKVFDRYNRRINYLRISITDRCNLRCTYCMPAGKVNFMKNSSLITFDEIEAVVRYVASKGFRQIRLTGGEPLAREGVVELVERIAAVKGIEDIGMTTNGIYLEKYAHDLAKAGLNRINISLDSVNPDRFRAITRLGDIEKVFRGIEAAKQAGLHPIKLNCVIEEHSNEPDAQGVREFAQKNGLEARFIRKMNLAEGKFWKVEGGIGGDCPLCNRIRLTADGHLRPCLFSNESYSIRQYGIEQAFAMTISNKPEKGIINKVNNFYNIGG